MHATIDKIAHRVDLLQQARRFAPVDAGLSRRRGAARAHLVERAHSTALASKGRLAHGSVALLVAHIELGVVLRVEQLADLVGRHWTLRRAEHVQIDPVALVLDCVVEGCGAFGVFGVDVGAGGNELVDDRPATVPGSDVERQLAIGAFGGEQRLAGRSEEHVDNRLDAARNDDERRRQTLAQHRGVGGAP